MRDFIQRLLERPVGVLVAAVAVVVMGGMSFFNIPVQMMPDGFESRYISISARLRDSSPAEAERHVAIPIEEQLGTVAGIESLSTRAGRTEVRVSLELKSDADPATVERDVRDRVARIEADLPDDVDRLRVRRRGMRDQPIMFYACTADVDRLELSDFMEHVLLARTESVDGVARASSWGLLKRTVRIRLDPEEVARRNLDLRDLLTRLRGDNLSADLGDVRDGGRKAFVRATMEFTSLDEIRNFPVLEGLRLGEIGTVEVVPALDQGWSRYNGKAVIVGTIYKTSDANTVATCKRVREQFDAVVARHKDKYPALTIRPFFDQGEVIESSLRTLYENALYGGILAVVILYGFFRRLRMTLLVAAALPLSLTIAITVLYLGGDTLNIATMMGLTLAVGMLIDNAIVVVESILRRREAGDAPRPAAANGTGEVALAVLTATLTTIVVFAPAIFLSDDTDARLWLQSIGGPIAFALLASLGVALVLIPLGSIYLRRRTDQTGDAVGTDRPLDSHSRYGRFLSMALRNRFAVVALAIVLCMTISIPLGAVGRKGAAGRGGGPVRVMLRFPRHYTMNDANEAMKKYEEYILPRLEEMEVDGIYARFDRYGGMCMMWKTDESEKPRDTLREEIRKGWPQIPGIWNSLESAAGGGNTKVTLEGEDAEVLERTMERIEARLRTLPQVAETSREREQGLQELQVRIDPEAIERGQVVPDWLRSMLGWVLRGARLRDYKRKGRDLPLLVELDPDAAVEVADLGALRVPTEQGMKPLASLTKLSIRSGPASIQRRDGRRVAEMEVAGKGDDDKAFHEQVSAVLGSTKLPPGVRFTVGGSWQKLQETFTALGKALLLGGLLVFLLTGILFEAFLIPLAVIFAVPPALVGAAWALHIAGKPIDELAFLGCILLVGIVVNNGIVLVDRVQQWRRRGLPLRPAITAAGRDRIRPVVMTAVTTIAGLLPMAIRKSADSEIPYDGLATAVIGGLVVSTAVTLVLVPVVFSLFVDLSGALTRIWRFALGRAQPRAR
ncbi:MAG: efflux RND transporter permease subunit [Planctomycetota bacterium]